MDVTAKPEPPDTLDRDRFREMIESPSFIRYRDRVSRELLRLMNDCQRLDEPRDIWRAQGAAGMVEAILRLPGVILAEMEAPKPQPKKR
jgi:hypothetical protein